MSHEIVIFNNNSFLFINITLSSFILLTLFLKYEKFMYANENMLEFKMEIKFCEVK